MKKLLALVLTFVMVMSMAAVSTNAALVDYTDADDFNYTEAIDVMSAVGVLEGADNQFRPTVQLKRSEAAKIVAYLNTNNRTAEGLIGVGKFSDVPTTHWAAGYIDYLSSINVLAGRGDVFDPDGDLTAVDFAKMLLVVLGFDPQIEGLVGSDYKINATKLATDAGLFKGLSELNPNSVLTREQAAQMAFNTVKAATVEYSNKGGEISINGATINMGASSFNYVTTTIAKNATNIDSRQLTNSGTNSTNSGYTIEFGERQYPDLRLQRVLNDFKRPVNVWTNGKDDIGTYVDQETMLGYFTTSVTGADLVELIGEAKIKNTPAADIRYAVNGFEFDYSLSGAGYQAFGVDQTNMTRSNKVPYGFTGNGVLTEVYDWRDQLIITSIMTYYVEADEDYNAKTGKLTYRFLTAVPDVDDPDQSGLPAPTFSTVFRDGRKISSEDFPEITTMKKNDRFLVRVFRNTLGEWEVGEILQPKEVKEGQALTQYSTSPDDDNVGTRFYNGYVKGTEQYNYAKTVFLSRKLRDYRQAAKALNPDYTLVFDPYGYVIAAIEDDVPDTYLFLSGLDTSGKNTAAGTASGFAIFSDGKSATITIDTGKSNDNINTYTTKNVVEADAADYWVQYAELRNDTGHAYNRWFTYSESGGIYTLSPVANGRTQIVDAVPNATANPNVAHSTTDANPRIRISSSQTRLVGSYINDYDVGVSTLNNAVGSQGDLDTNGGPRTAQTAWFNEKSVIITVDTGITSANPTETHASYNRGIAEVTAVYTGIQGVDIVAHPLQKVDATGSSTTDELKKMNPFAASVWTVFDKNQNILYAIVVGQDAGGSDSYVYATSAAQSERYDGTYYYWDFNGIVDGEEKVLNVKTRYNTLFSDVTNRVKFDSTAGGNNALFKATFDKDGYVNSLVPVEYFGITGVMDNAYNNTDRSAGTGYNQNDVVYSVYDAANDTLSVAGRTLWLGNETTDTDNGSYKNTDDVGLAVMEGAKIFVVQQYQYVSTGKTTTVVTECKDLSAALGEIWAYGSEKDWINRSNPDVNPSQVGSRNSIWGFNGYIAASLDKSGHLAKWVVIKPIGTPVNVNNTQTVTPGAGSGSASTTCDGGKTVTVNLGEEASTGTTISYRIEMLASNGEFIQVVSGNYVTAADTTALVFEKDGLAATSHVQFNGFSASAIYKVFVKVGGGAWQETNTFVYFD